MSQNEKPSLSTLLQALSQQHQRNTSRTYHDSSHYFTQIHDAENAVNLRHLHCTRCKETIMSVNVAKYEESEMQLPGKDDSKQETHQKWWKVPSVMHFDNVAVSNVTAPQQELDVTRYLTCAACERDVLGYINSKGEGFVACDVVEYRGEPEKRE